ncbi:hypothetical protein HIM_12418 [Hirsutella minnesotensis 3608]|uniref:Uncharacterized protein n=1 Tax=Hirsutella minnesotensis 3608 TaxID=1043627 RepID=A0A0F7ZQN9_9HYPO|nr:hypothetical protein HIM_12418 [Hirsutella minnesotensis 3608]
MDHQQQLEPSIPLPPTSPTFASHEELIEFLQSFYRECGAALVTASSNKRRKVDSISMLSYVVLVCDRGLMRLSQSAGLRNASTRKVDCPVRITASATKSKDQQ